jgi:predicted kinase
VGGTSPIPADGVIELPDPVLVVLVGAAGAGKSTLAARLFDPEQVLSSDAYREKVGGDAADQSVTRAAFSILHRELGRRMAERLTTVVDATNVTSFARRSVVRRAAAHGIPAVAILLDLDPRLVRARNATRPGRIVPEAAVRAQLADLERSLRRGQLSEEGFASVHHVRAPDELDRLSLRRSRRR